MTISATGDGLNILISCDYLLHHNWMSYFCWYSLQKNLPDAKVFVASPRKIMNANLFDWARKCKVPLILHKELDLNGQIEIVLSKGAQQPLLVVSPENVCVRDFDEASFSPEGIVGVKILDEELSCDCKEDRFCVFVTYSKGWGKFVTGTWINKTSCPFFFGSRYAQGGLNANEVRIDHLWTAATPLFQTISRG